MTERSRIFLPFFFNLCNFADQMPRIELKYKSKLPPPFSVATDIKSRDNINWKVIYFISGRMLVTIQICCRALGKVWFPLNLFAGIFVPESGRYFLTSYTGLWRLCRYALTPVLLGNATLPVLLETLVLTNKSRIQTIREEIGAEPYISEFQRNLNGSIEKITKIDNQFKESLFAEWIRNSTNFPKLKAKYKELRPNDTNAVPKPSTSKTKTSEFKTIPYNMTDIEETLHGSQYTIVKRNRTADLLMPDNLQRALFDGWEQRPNIILVLGEFAKSLDMSATLTTANGSRIILQPPVPPNKKILSNGEFSYKKYGKRLSTLPATCGIFHICQFASYIRFRFSQKIARTIISFRRTMKKSSTRRSMKCFWVSINSVWPSFYKNVVLSRARAKERPIYFWFLAGGQLERVDGHRWLVRCNSKPED